MALSVPSDARSEPEPATLAELAGEALAVFDAAAAGDWARATAGLDAVNVAWATYRASGHVPDLLAVQMDRALAALAGDSFTPAVHAHNAVGSRNAALDVAHASLDLQLHELFTGPGDRLASSPRLMRRRDHRRSGAVSETLITPLTWRFAVTACEPNTTTVAPVPRGESHRRQRFNRIDGD